jgi:dethiobiotin synthetase
VIVLVAGTGTEVGKTWVTAATARLLRRLGVRVRAYKPVQSFAPEDDATDAHVLADATGAVADDVCPPHRWLPVPMAPPMAAALLDRPAFTIADLTAEVPRDGPGILLVEAAGGVRSPLADDGDTVALAAACRPARVVLVADAGLGTINAVRLSVDALASQRVLVHLNRFDADDDLHVRNRDWLVTRERLEVLTDPQALADTLRSLASA